MTAAPAAGQMNKAAQVTKGNGEPLPEYPFAHEGLVLADGNKAVVQGGGLGHLCGYVCLRADQVPHEWHGNYDADALQYLAIHGGITYCKVAGGDAVERSAREQRATESIERAPFDPADEGKACMDSWRARREAIDAAALSVEYPYVVFGFDCGHSGDDENELLRGPTHVMNLARDMESLLLAYAAQIKEWRAAGRDARIAMVEAINAKVDNKPAPSFGAMIGLLGGAPEFGETA